MAISEAQKKANRLWDKENMTTLGCKVKKEQAEKFKQYATANKTTANTLLKKFVLEKIGEIGGEDSMEGTYINPQTDAIEIEHFLRSKALARYHCADDIRRDFIGYLDNNVFDYLESHSDSMRTKVVEFYSKYESNKGISFDEIGETNVKQMIKDFKSIFDNNNN